MSSLTASDLADTPAEALNQRRLPFTFAKRHGVLLQVTAEGVRLAYRAGVSLAALAEAQRFVGQTFRPAANTSAGQGSETLQGLANLRLRAGGQRHHRQATFGAAQAE